MPKKTTDVLLKQVLPELEQIVQQLDCGADDLDGLDESESLTEFEPNLIKPELVNLPEKLMPQDH